MKPLTLVFIESPEKGYHWGDNWELHRTGCRNIEHKQEFHAWPPHQVDNFEEAVWSAFGDFLNEYVADEDGKTTQGVSWQEACSYLCVCPCSANLMNSNKDDKRVAHLDAIRWIMS